LLAQAKTLKVLFANLGCGWQGMLARWGLGRR
jgi:hypothetical protein